MAYVDPRESTAAFKQILARQGGGLLFHGSGSYPDSWPSYRSLVKRPDGYKPFEISVYNDIEKRDLFTLTLLVNPVDISIGQVYLANEAYTRRGWLPTLWGPQQITITASGISGAFYMGSTNLNSGDVGLTNYNRKDTLSFINLLSLIGIYRNNGYYFLEEIVNESFFGDRTSRVIDVIDHIKISYDGTEYLGSFNIFTIDEDATKPYNIAYNFEFVVSGIKGDAFEGHVRVPGRTVGDITIGEQGYNTRLSEIIQMDESELNADLALLKQRPDLDTSSIARGQLDEKLSEKFYDGTKYLAKDLPKTSYEEQPESVKAAVREAAYLMGLSELQLAAIIQFESAGTWNTRVGNPRSEAVGIGQWVDVAAQQMGFDNAIDLVNTVDTVEGQVSLYITYANRTKVRGGRTLQQAIDMQTTPQDKFNTYMIGHFLPKFVGLPLNTEIPQTYQDKNPGIVTLQDYIDFINREFDRLEGKNTLVQ